MAGIFLALSALFGATGIALGAWGAHGLANKLAPAKLAAWNTAVSYQLLHGVVLLALSLYSAHSGVRMAVSGWLLTLGIVCFSGSIYALVLGRMTFLGPVTPIGGLCLMAGWLSLFWLRP